MRTMHTKAERKGREGKGRGLYLFGSDARASFRADLAFRVDDARSVGRFQHAIDAHQPVLGRVRFLQVLEADVLVADLGAARSIEARRRTEVQLNSSHNANTGAASWPATDQRTTDVTRTATPTCTSPNR